ncbi:hypothetical protein BT96DRAFT_992999 [Gymnopus androsaceus JB14]|uniref:Uncharacterized protein n=1 Tax=Gymnopus androsaceus JB14 TaxID=1447944 RepID=A0A6A4HR99_9AGAR|nr:hypothetical protein BT96DRAFT_992999 [Gymnopus androsaceus JB14]
MKPTSGSQIRALSCLSLVADPSALPRTWASIRKGGGGSHDSESSSFGRLGPRRVFIFILNQLSIRSDSTHRSNTCVYQNTNEVVACPKNSWTSTIAVIIALAVKQWYIRRERKRNTLGAAKQSAGFYQPIDGHVHPEGAYYASSMSNYSLGEDEEKKIFMPEPVLAQGL